MNPQALSEINYWTYKCKELGGVDKFIEYRSGGLDYRKQFFPNFDKQKGLGLDMGCGPVSIFEWSDKEVIAVEPLINQFDLIAKKQPSKVTYVCEDGENTSFEDGKFDWIWCYNVIDHTPEPQKMADEMYRLLKKGGNLYLLVNFDDVLSKSHYALWDKEMADNIFKKFKVKYENTQRSTEHPQYLHSLILTK